MSEPKQDTIDILRPEREGWSRVRPSAFTHLIGPVWVRLVDGWPRYAFTVQEKHDNTARRAHGGMVMAFADEVMGVAAYHVRPDDDHLTISFTTQFIDGARLGEFVEIEPELIRMTRSLVFLNGRVHVAGRTIATCSGVWKTLNRKAGTT